MLATKNESEPRVRSGESFLSLLIISGLAATLLYWVAIEYGSYFIPPSWLGNMWNTLKAWGVPPWFLTGYLIFAWQRIRSWIGLAVLNFAIGLSTAAWSRRVAVLVAAWLPVIEFLFDCLYCIRGGPGIQSGSDARQFLFAFHIRFVSLWGVALGIGAWYLGRRCRLQLKSRR